MIDIENLTRKFDDLTAVDSLTFHVDEGEVFGFLGAQTKSVSKSRDISQSPKK